ncbi:MAG TPA: PAS domain-containing protein, partial [Allocoleopsis sp.]
RALISALPDLIMRVTGDGIYLDFLAARNFKVLGGKDLIGTRVEDSLPPALAQLRMTAIQTALQTGELQIYEQEIWIEDTLRTEECRVLAYDEHEVLIIGRDITEQKQAEMELRQREAQLQAIAANIPGYLYRYVVHADGTSTLPYLSAGAEQLFGLPLSAIRTGMENSLSLIYADDRPTVNAAIAAGVQALTPGNIEFRMIDATGALKWLNLIFQVHRTEKGDTVFDGICLDISEKKQLELDRQQAKVTLRENEEKFQTDRQHAEAALRESEARFRQIAETVREGFFVFESASSRYSYVNPAYTAITGIPAELLYQEGTSCWQNHLHPDDRARITERLQQEIQGEMFDEEYRFVQPDGRIRWVRAQMFPLRDDNGVTVRTVGTL